MKMNMAFRPLLNNERRFCFLIGGAGSGKSRFCAQKVVFRVLNTERERILVIRKVARTLKGSVFQLFKDIIAEENLGHLFSVNKSSFSFYCSKTGSEIICCGIDDPDKIKSITGITSIWIEEASELDYEDFMQLNLRLRGETPNYKQIMLSTNPIDEELWIKQFIDNPDNADVLTVSTSTFLDNAMIDDEYKHELLNRYKTNELWYMIYVEGKWGKVQRGGEFYKKFKYNKHVVKGLPYDPKLPLHLSFDFNVNPYMSLAIFQIKDKKICQIDEICTKNPYNTTKDICKEFKMKYATHKSGLFVYGDPSGKQEDTRSEKGSDDFKIIETQLSAYSPSRRVHQAHPPVAMRGNFINACLEHNFEGIEIFIEEGCKNTVNDFMYMKEAADGRKFKQKVKDKDSGVTYEKYGHLSDCFDYLITFAFSSEFSLFQRGSKPFATATFGKNPSRHDDWAATNMGGGWEGKKKESLEDEIF